MLTVYLSMLVFALTGAISPGPVNIIAASTGASFGFVRTLPHVLGATIGYTLVVFVSGMGLGELLAAYPQLTLQVQVLGAAFLLWLAWKIATAPVTSDEVDKLASPPGIVAGALAQMLNPKAWLVALSGVSLFVSGQDGVLWYLLAFCAISFAMCFCGVSSWAVLGHLARRLLSDPRNAKLFNRLMALLLTGTVVLMFVN